MVNNSTIQGYYTISYCYTPFLDANLQMMYPF